MIKTTTTRPFIEVILNLNSRKARVGAKKNTVSEKKSLTSLFEAINALKRQLKPEKTVYAKKRKVESLLSTEGKLTTSSSEDEEYFATSP